jgi:Tol biopolymer transport system component/DNA-binding winged helix-turn-helix (wHTH) protein
VTPAKCYAFGPFVLDPARGVLLRQGVRIPLTPRTFNLLTVLVTRAGEVLDKDALMREVWAGTIVEENNLARQISSIRKVLGEKAGNREYIATVPGVGYRFIAPVSVVDESVTHLIAAPPPPAPAWMSRPTFAVVSFLLVAVAVAGTFVLRQASAPEAIERSMQQYTFGSGMQQDPAWSPDGQRIAFASDRDGSVDLWVQNVESTDATRLTTSPAREWQPNWSPDGRSLVFRSEQNGGGLFVIAASGGEPRQVAAFGDRPQWSPRGDLILFSNATVRTGARKLYVVDPSGGSPREILADALEPFTASGWVDAVEASWHPDGRRVSLWGRAGAAWLFVTVPVTGGARVESSISDTVTRAIDESRLRLGRFVWARSARFLYFEGQTGDVRNVWRVPVNASTLAWTSPPQRLTTDVGDEADIALSPDGSRLAFTVRSQRTSLWSLDFDPATGRLAGGGTALTSGVTGQVDVDTLPDGSRVAYRAMRAGRSEVREFKTSNREERVLLVSNEWSPSVPRWSSDGRRLAYSRPGAGVAMPNRNIVAVVSPDEQHEQLISMEGDVGFRPSDWSLDGRTILGDCRPAQGGAVSVCAIPAPAAASGSARPRTLMIDESLHLFGPRFSPDQRWISFVAVDRKGSTSSRLFVAPVGGGPWIPITDGRSFDDKARWAPDGRAIYFVSDRNGFLNLSGRRFDPVAGLPVGEPFAVTSFDTARRGLPANISQIEFAVTRKQLFVPITETGAEIWVLDRVDR